MRQNRMWLIVGVCYGLSMIALGVFGESAKWFVIAVSAVSCAAVCSVSGNIARIAV